MNLLEQFRFVHPQWLLLIPASMIYLWLNRRRGGADAIRFSTLRVLATLGQSPRRRVGALAIHLSWLALIMAIVAMARPVLREQLQQRTASGIDIMIAFDVSLSMEIDDFLTAEGEPLQRLDAAKAVVTNFVRNRPDDRIGLVVFSGQPYHISPITLEHEWLLNELAAVRLNHRGEGTVKEQGTAIGSAISAAATRLQSRESKSKIIVLITDGANNSGKISPIDAAKYAADLGIKIYAVAIGTKEGRVSSNIQKFPRQEFDLPTLAEVSRLSGAEHYWAQTTAQLADTFQTIDRLEKSEHKSYTVNQDTELFLWPCSCALIFCLIAAAISAMKRPLRAETSPT